MGIYCFDLFDIFIFKSVFKKNKELKYLENQYHVYIYKQHLKSIVNLVYYQSSTRHYTPFISFCKELTQVPKWYERNFLVTFSISNIIDFKFKHTQTFSTAL